MIRHGLPANYPATPLSREAMTLMLDAALAATGQKNPGSVYRGIGNMKPNTEPRPSGLACQSRFYTPTKPRPRVVYVRV
jgi:hypothetical protein